MTLTGTNVLYRDALIVSKNLDFFWGTLTKSFNLLSMINETVNRGREIFAYLINQSTGVSNGIFKHFKLGIDKEPKAFKRTRNWKRSTHNKLHKRFSWVLLDKSEAMFRWLLRLSFKNKKWSGDIKTELKISFFCFPI